MTNTTKYTIDKKLATELIQATIKHRKAQWPALIAEGKMTREESNHRYACLVDLGALLLEESPKFHKSEQEIFAETSIWAREEKQNMLNLVLEGKMNRHDMDRAMKVIDQIIDITWSTKK